MSNFWAQSVLILPSPKIAQRTKCYNIPKLYTTNIVGSSESRIWPNCWPNSSWGALLEEWGGTSSLSFFKIGKKCPNFGNQCPDHIQLWVKFLISDAVLRVSMKKYLIFFPARAFLCVLQIKCLWKCHYFKKLPQRWKIPDYAPGFMVRKSIWEKWDGFFYFLLFCTIVRIDR